jgi:hypothetical protein
MSNKCCCTCGEVLWMEQLVIQKLGGDSSTVIDFCLECQTKAFHAVLSKLIINVPDANRRHALRARWNRVTAGTGAAVLDN